jgi:hypothetical protein
MITELESLATNLHSCVASVTAEQSTQHSYIKVLLQSCVYHAVADSPKLLLLLLIAPPAAADPTVG